MCGRFYVPEDDANEIILRILKAADARAGRLEAGTVARGEVFPTQTVAAIALGRNGQRDAFPMRWGYNLGNGKQLINTRSETAHERLMFRDSFARRRCLIPAAYYFEWQRNGPAKRRFALRPGWDGPVWLMGIYRYEEGKRLPALSILTRPAAPEIAFIHDRMPVICPPERADDWLDPDAKPDQMVSMPQPMMYKVG